MKLSVYLMLDDVTSFEDALLSKYLAGTKEYARVKPKPGLQFECVAFVQASEPSVPRWAGFLNPGFDVQDLRLENRSSAFVLLLRVSNRTFALTFGMGFQALDRAKIEPRFGLMVAANSVNPEAVSTLESTLIESSGRNRRTHVTEGAPFSEFELDPNMDYIRRLSGKVLDDSFGKSMCGTDAATINIDCEFEHLDRVCERLLERFESQSYKKYFPQIDKLVPLHRKDVRVTQLNQEIERLLLAGEGKIALSLPDGIDEELVSHYKLSCNHQVRTVDYLELTAIQEFISEAATLSPLEHVYIVGIGDSDQPVTKRSRLSEYLVCELKHPDMLYVYCHGHWHAAEYDFVSHVRDEVSALSDLTSELALPTMDGAEDEGAYNDRTGLEKGYLVLDRKNFQIPKSHDRIEICDLFTHSRYLICVKKMSSSAALSHLFAQGSVSANLLRTMATYRQSLELLAQSEWNDFGKLAEDDVTGVTVVYAIATSKTGSLSDGMFFFSMVNLLSHVRVVKQYCKIALCKIDLDPVKPELKRIKRNRKLRTKAAT